MAVRGTFSIENTIWDIIMCGWYKIAHRLKRHASKAADVDISVSF